MQPIFFDTIMFLQLHMEHTQFTAVPVVHAPFPSIPMEQCSISLNSNEACSIYIEMLKHQIAQITPSNMSETMINATS